MLPQPDAAVNIGEAKPTAARRWLIAAMTGFLLVKLAWVFVPAAVMGLPRLGDDALVYLWSGASTVAQPRTQQPAIHDILQLRKEGSDLSPQLEYSRARVAMRTTGVSASPIALGTGAVLHGGAGHKLAFAIIEAVIAVVLCAAVAYGLGLVAGPGAAAATLAVTALAILPNQGLHYLVPSVFVLAAALLLWATVLLRPGRWGQVLLLALVMLFTHTIGMVYLLGAAAMVIAKGVLTRRLDAAQRACLAAMALSVPLWLAVSALTGARAPMTPGLGGLSLADVPLNAAGLAIHLKTLAWNQPVLFFTTAAGLFRAMQQRRARPDAFILVGVLSAVVLSTVVVHIPGYPGELPSRALIALVIACTGVSASWALEASTGMRHRARWLAAAVLGVLCTQLPLFMGYGIGNINSRHQIYDSGSLAAEVGSMPSGAAVVWTDTDVAMMAALLEGADRLHAVPYPMLATATGLRERTARSPAVFVAASQPERLNGTSVLGSWSLKPRFYGWDFSSYRRVSVDVRDGAPLPLYLRLRGNPGALSVTREDGGGCRLEPVPSEDGGWFRVGGCAPGGSLRLESDPGGPDLTGLALRRPDPRCAWPWGEPAVRVRAEPRRSGDTSEVHFSLSHLMGENASRDIARELGPLTVYSCRSGLVWLQANVNKAGS